WLHCLGCQSHHSSGECENAWNSLSLSFSFSFSPSFSPFLSRRWATETAETVQPFRRNLKNIICQLSTKPSVLTLSRGMVRLTAKTEQPLCKNGKNIVCQLSTRPTVHTCRQI